MDHVNGRPISTWASRLGITFTWLALTALPAAADVCRAAPDGVATANGASWGAATTLVDALANGNGKNCTDIWLKQGTYTQTSATTGFLIARNLKLYGGFVGTEAALGDRSSAVDPALTTLDGEGTRRVLYINGTTSTGSITSATVLDGLTIANGKFTSWGGGLYCNASLFRALPARSCSPTLNRVVFKSNQAKQGAGLFLDAGNSGTGVVSPSLTDVVFDGNQATGPGGALYVWGEMSGVAQPTITGATFSGNSATLGGAIYTNSGSQSGASVVSPVITNATFFQNSVLPNATTINTGGAIHIDGQVGTNAMELTNVTFNQNRANGTNQFGGALSVNGAQAKPVITNAILWGDLASNSARNEVYLSVNAAPTFSHSIVQGSGGSGAWGTGLGTDGGGNLDADPLLPAALADNGGLGQTLLLPANSAALAQGDPAHCPALDQRGVARPAGQPCDLGAVQGPPSYRLALSHTGPGHLSSTTPACNTTATGSCTAQMSAAGTVSVQAVADSGAALSAWGGACAGTVGNTCNVQVNGISAASATFSQLPTYTIGGSVSGLSGSGLKLKNNNADELTVNSDGLFTFATSVASGGSYAVTVSQQPSGQSCGVTNDSGSNVQANVTNVQVTCSASTYPISGTITGLTGSGLTLSVNGTNHAVSGSSFSIPNAVPRGGNYSVTVSSQPSGQTCNVTSGASGSNVTGPVAGVAVSCVTPNANTYTITTAVQPAPSPGNDVGTFTCQPGNPVPQGASVTCTARPTAGFALSALEGDCTRSDTATGTCHLDDVQADKSVTARFAPVTTHSGTTVPGPASASFTGGGPTCRFDASQTGFVAAPMAPPAGQTLPQGMFKFRLIGCDHGSTVTMHITWPQAVTGYAKHGKATAGAADASYFTPTGLAISGNTVSFTVQDGALGDDDWAPNGVITDPSMPLAAAGPVTPPTPVPTLGQWALMVLGLLAAGLGMRRLRGA